MASRSTASVHPPSVVTMFRPLKSSQLTTDIVLAALCVLLRTVFGFESVLFIFVVLGMAASLAIRRLSPGLALALVWFTVIVQMFGMGRPDLANLAILPVLFATAAYGGKIVKWLGLASAGAGALVGTVYIVLSGYLGTLGTGNIAEIAQRIPQLLSLSIIGFLSALAVFGLSWTLGLLVQTWRSARDSRAAQAAAEAEQADAEREVGIEQERTRIARDMHDVVAHSLAVVIAQADGARYARHTDPDSVDEALTTIASTAREALGDVRILLGQLRHSDGQGPQPLLADLDRLIDQMRASGLGVQREEVGAPLAVGTGQQLAVYRIVQEALTNALRHGDTAEDVVVRFAWTTDVLTVTVANLIGSRPAEPAVRAGHGLDGMRERAILAGGSLSTGERAGYFVVTATLPVLATSTASITVMKRPAPEPAQTTRPAQTNQGVDA